MKKYVGKNYPIHDAWEKATGEKIYTGDMKIPGMNYGKILFSPIPFGRVKKIDTKKARELNGVIGIFTHENTPLKKYNNYFSFAGQKGIEDERLFTDVVRYVGDKVAAVVAVSPEIADEALKLIEVEYEKYEPIVDIYQALSGGSSIHENGNILNDGIIKAGDVDKVLKEASDTFTTKVHVPRLHHGAMERHVCLSTYNVLGELTIWTPCQSVFAVRNAVAAFLNMSYSDVRVVKTTTGGSFGGKQQMILEIVGAYLAKEVKGPVMIEYSRDSLARSP